MQIAVVLGFLTCLGLGFLTCLLCVCSALAQSQHDTHDRDPGISTGRDTDMEPLRETETSAHPLTAYTGTKGGGVHV